MSSKETIGELIERAQRGEDLQLPRPTHDVFARLECLTVDWQNGLPLSQDDYDFLMDYTLASPLSRSLGSFRGRRLKREQLIAEEEKELARWRKFYRKLMASPVYIESKDALARAANKLLDKTKAPLFMKNATERMSVNTVIDRLKRSPQR